MSKTLMDLLATPTALSTAQLADTLGTSIEMIEAQLERYEQLGYIKKTVMCGSSCSCNCKGCGYCTSNDRKGSPVVFWEKLKK
ncbi:MAG: hypothetical protein WC900_02375 [Oscillospiraceae bacterium]